MNHDHSHNSDNWVLRAVLTVLLCALGLVALQYVLVSSSGVLAANAPADSPQWQPVVNPIETDHGYVPGLWLVRPEPGVVCVLAYGHNADLLSCVREP